MKPRIYWSMGEWVCDNYSPETDAGTFGWGDTPKEAYCSWLRARAKK